MPVWLDAASVDRDLDGIKRKIDNERQGLSQVQKKEGSVLQSLGQIENDLERKTKELKAAKAKLASISADIRAGQAEAEQIRSSIGKRQERFKERAVALYRWQRSASPFLILNGNMSMSGLLQRSHYLQTTVQFDRDLINRLEQDAKAQEALRAKLARKQQDLDAQQEVLSEATASVQAEAQKKRELLASLKQEKDTRTRALKELEAAALRLQKMMDDLQRQATARPPEFPAGAGLDSMKGRLSWPVRGELKSEFGKTRHKEFAAEVFRNGIDIEAPFGEEIKAVERGKVVFADRLAGYGKTVIVDHGERYYTIYAHLSEIMKKNGESVKRGETVGLVGDSDSLSGAGLYFEMRKDGHSIDPVPWFRKS
ncbi:MAG TPA: peptidoglycan DD-metalloendopeptidase family protein [Candidatus Binatia bacterium]